MGDSTPELGRHVLSLGVPVPGDGQYRVSIVPVLGPGQGTVHLLRDDQPFGTPLDTRNECRRVGEATPLGELAMELGEGGIHLRIVPSMLGTRRAALDVMRVVLERVR